MIMAGGTIRMILTHDTCGRKDRKTSFKKWIAIHLDIHNYAIDGHAGSIMSTYTHRLLGILATTR